MRLAGQEIAEMKSTQGGQRKSEQAASAKAQAAHVRKLFDFAQTSRFAAQRA
jgi:hypothetical protein